MNLTIQGDRETVEAIKREIRLLPEFSVLAESSQADTEQFEASVNQPVTSKLEIQKRGR
jgi:hypothetical protein